MSTSQQPVAGPMVDRTTAGTRALLACGIIAGPMYVAVAFAQALTRDGFDLTRHAWSLLSNGDLGWIQITNFCLTGLLVLALAAGLRRVLSPGRGATWGPRLLGGYGVGLVAAGVFRADPVLGFPVGTPEVTAVSWHGGLHFLAGAVGFGCLVAACLVIAGRFAADGRRGWALFSRITGGLFLAGFVAMGAGGGRSATNVAFTVAIVLAWVWLSALAVDLYRRTGRLDH